MPDGFSDGSQAIAAVEVPASACDDDASWPLSAEVEASADAMWPRQGPRRAGSARARFTDARSGLLARARAINPVSRVIIVGHELSVTKAHFRLQ